MTKTTLWLSGAALLMAGAAQAADLPSKKAAPAVLNYVKICDAFGAGFFTIPGGDTCIQLSGHMKGQATFAAPVESEFVTKRSQSWSTWGSRFRLNVDVRSNTDLGVLRGFARLDNGKVAYGYAQLGGLSAGFQDTAFAFFNSDNTDILTTDDGLVTNALSYTAGIGSGVSATLAIEDSSKRQTALTTVGGASQIPDIVGNVRFGQGPVTFQLSAASHQNYGLLDGDKMGYAVQGGVHYFAMPETALWLQGTYVKGALSYLGYNGVDDHDFIASDVGELADGYSVLAALGQKAGPGTINLIASYGQINDVAASTRKITQLEANYGWNPVKNFTVMPSIAYVHIEGGISSDTTKGQIRIQRDF